MNINNNSVRVVGRQWTPYAPLRMKKNDEHDDDDDVSRVDTLVPTLGGTRVVI